VSSFAFIGSLLIIAEEHSKEGSSSMVYSFRVEESFDLRAVAKHRLT